MLCASAPKELPTVRTRLPVPFLSPLNSQYMAPARPWRIAYCALSVAMAGVSYEMSCCLAASYEYDDTLLVLSYTVAPAKGKTE